MANVKNWKDDLGIDEINDECYQCQVFDDRGTTVANAFGETPDECTEHAKLIAAAPDMLEALKAIREWESFGNHIDSDIMDLVNVAIDEADLL